MKVNYGGASEHPVETPTNHHHFTVYLLLLYVRVACLSEVHNGGCYRQGDQEDGRTPWITSCNNLLRICKFENCKELKELISVNFDKGNALKNDQVDKFNGNFIHYFQLQCNTSSFDVDEFYNCTRSIIHVRDEMIFDALTFNLQKFIMENLTINWEPLMLHWGFGMCQTIKNLGKLEISTSIKIALDKTKKYRIWLHDPNFFYMSMNPSSFPRIQTLLLNLKNWKTGSSKNQYILAEEHLLLDREKAPCTDYTIIGSSFSQCIVDFVRNETGCRVMWI